MTTVFRKPWLRLAARLFDGAGGKCRPRKKRAFPADARKILVIRLDNIGDVVLSEPFLRALKEQKPECIVTCLITSAGNAILSRSKAIDHLMAFDPAWFSSQRNRLKMIRDWFKLVRLIRHVDADIIVDLRGDVRHIVAARIAKPKAWILSYGITGGGFLLDRQAVYSDSDHAAQRNMHLLSMMGLKNQTPATLTAVASEPLADSIQKLLPPKTGPWIALHAGAGMPAKAWPVSHWQKLLEKISARNQFELFWIGDRNTCAIIKNIREGFKAGGVDLSQQLPIGQLGTFLKRCDLLISVDSGPVHIAAAHQVPTLALFSGTNEVRLWRPLNGNVKILTQPVSCAPCHQRICPKPHHDCMTGLSPETVLRAMDELLTPFLNNNKEQKIWHEPI